MAHSSRAPQDYQEWTLVLPEDALAYSQQYPESNICIVPLRDYLHGRSISISLVEALRSQHTGNVVWVIKSQDLMVPLIRPLLDEMLASGEAVTAAMFQRGDTRLIISGAGVPHVPDIATPEDLVMLANENFRAPSSPERSVQDRTIELVNSWHRSVTTQAFQGVHQLMGQDIHKIMERVLLSGTTSVPNSAIRREGGELLATVMNDEALAGVANGCVRARWASGDILEYPMLFALSRTWRPLGSSGGTRPRTVRMDRVA